MRLTDFRVLTFDCYGTLIDWETGMLDALRPLTSRLQGKLEPDEILAAHARYESLQQVQTPTKLYSHLLAIVYKRMAEEWALAVSWNECVRYGESVKSWTPFPDSTESLKYLKQHYKLVILSNVDNESFSASNDKLDITFDAVFTAEEIGNYKPNDANFHYMIEMLAQSGVNQSDILHTAESMFHDHQPANRLGLNSCWINRRHGQIGFGATRKPSELPRYDFQFTSLADMVQAHKNCLRDGSV